MDVSPTTGEIILSDSYADTEKHYPDDSWSGTGNNVFGCIKQMYALKLKNRHLKVLFSVGGWTYAQAGHFAFALDAGLRQAFVKSAIQYIEDYGFDGVDIDWEFPANDKEKDAYTALFTELRTALDALQKSKGDSSPYILSTAVSMGPANYAHYDVGKVDSQIDFWNLMAYDYAGSWSNYTADNANLYYGETTGFNTDQALQYYFKQGATPGKMTLGLPLYGRSFVGTDGIYEKFSGIGTADTAHGSWEAGVYDYKALPLDGAKVTENKTSVASYSYDSAAKQLISFDTPNIIKLKTEYLVKNKLAGSMFWELSGDKKGEDSLIAITAKGMGALDSSENHINYPNSKYDNIKNNLGGSTGGGSSSSSGAATPSSSTEANPPSSSSTASVPSSTDASLPPISPSVPTPTPTTPSSCPAKRRAA
jgi:chitinase